LDALIAATRPTLTAQGIAVCQFPSFVETHDHKLRPTLHTRILCGDEALEFSTPLYVTDQTMQGFGAAITYARRYAWAAALGIASEEDTDAATYTGPEEDVPF
jgi:hypothetical protein